MKYFNLTRLIDFGEKNFCKIQTLKLWKLQLFDDLFSNVIV